MEVYTSEQEQVEAIKKWWDENGRMLIIGVVVALAAVFGWRTWQDNREEKMAQASNHYQMLLEHVNAGEGREVTEVGRRIIGEYQDTAYAVLASLAMAQQAADQGDLDGASAHLRWAMDNSALAEIKDLARSRLARLLIAQGKPDEALKLLAGLDKGSFSAVYQEIRGDAYLAQGKRAEAHQAYSAALADFADTPAKQQLLRMKLDDLADAGAKAQ